MAFVSFASFYVVIISVPRGVKRGERETPPGTGIVPPTEVLSNYLHPMAESATFFVPPKKWANVDSSHKLLVSSL